jgi:flagellar motility protein MotE (MotC chaperone)
MADFEDPKAAKAKLKADKKEYQKKLKEQKKEHKAKELEFEERTEEINGDNAGGFATIVITLLIILIWLAIMALLIKLDVGGFGSGILAPLIKDIPYLNLILPDGSVQRDTGTTDESSAEASIEGMDSLDEANAYIRRLEQALQAEMEQNSSYAMTIDRLEMEVARLEPFERQQKEFLEERASFYSSIVLGEYAPDAAAYASYYAMIDPDNAAELYQRVITDQSDDAAIRAFANTYSGMKAKKAAGIFDEMINENQIDLVARMLAQMTTENRSDILASMETANAAKLTQILEPLALQDESPRVSGKTIK